VKTKTLFHRRVIGSMEQSVHCWYLLLSEDGTIQIEPTWEHSTGQPERDIGSRVSDAERFAAQTRDAEVLGSLNAALPHAVNDHLRTWIDVDQHIH
jgi:hypothetical protein